MKIYIIQYKFPKNPINSKWEIVIASNPDTAVRRGQNPGSDFHWENIESETDIRRKKYMTVDYRYFGGAKVYEGKKLLGRWILVEHW